ncbi:M20/M25/M40 family metallo-hydrolase [Anaerocolumna xylanovorans]|uniref:Peptidase T-like protein n=1 Tax=Anaerocolumna xylanovorans DSM 12503 TaxID=1121345 RepID=A0A1M7Y4Q4_9FIRM|nr:M20/M25/M40 family metallo-hydrolase [Anaerocolumna xylanovorans]SHO47328.1 peptidase T-like protein [Anaerocolumna xylanovorans DSM 12503]
MADRKRIIEEFKELVSIDAPSFEERKMADVLTKKLRDLGFTVTEDGAGKVYEGNAGNLYAFLPGELEGTPILLSAHMDTVEPSRNKTAVVREDGTITSDGTTVLGADDLSGVTAILEAVRSIKEKKIPHRSIEVLFAIAEEVYIRGSEVFDYSLIKAKEAYVLDLSGKVGTAALKAPTLLSFEAVFTGKAAHAGFAPEEGIHAIKAAAKAVTAIQMGRIDRETTVNVGLIEGGLARNIVPENCILKGEVRSIGHEKALEETEKIRRVFTQTAEEAKAVLKFTTSYGCLAYAIEKEAPVVQRFERACRELSIPTSYVETFGGSDNNNFVRNNIEGIVMACGMNDVHSAKEWTHIDELERCTEIVIKLLTFKD